MERALAVNDIQFVEIVQVSKLLKMLYSYALFSFLEDLNS